MLIAISGAQGQGKSTVISDLVGRGYKSIENKTSRTILTEWDYTLDEINRDLKLKRKFQDEILNRHYEYSKHAIDSDEIFFIERSYADIFAYTLVSLGPYNDYSYWLNQYYERCLELQQNFHYVFHISGRDIEPEYDGIRSINIHFAEFINDAIVEYCNKFNATGSFHSVNIADRVCRVDHIIKKIIGGIMGEKYVS